MPLLLLLAACAPLRPSQFVAPTGAEVEAGLGDPAAALVIVYNHGSPSDKGIDPCAPQESGWRGTPPVLRALAGQRVRGYTVRVYGFCSPPQSGTYDATLRLGHPKVDFRAGAILEQLRAFEDQGVPPQRLFLAGHSAGAWSSLIVARRDPQALNGVLAFAPAFAGWVSRRTAGWWWVRQREVEAFLATAQPLPSLIYAFPADPFETPQSLAFFRRVRGVQLAPQDPGCFRGHNTPFQPCFTAQLPRIRAWLEARLRAGGVPDRTGAAPLPQSALLLQPAPLPQAVQPTPPAAPTRVQPGLRHAP